LVGWINKYLEAMVKIDFFIEFGLLLVLFLIEILFIQLKKY